MRKRNRKAEKLARTRTLQKELRAAAERDHNGTGSIFLELLQESIAQYGDLSAEGS